MLIDGQLKISPHPTMPSVFIVTEGFSVEWDGEIAIVPVGALVNGASIPKFLHWIIPPWHPHYSLPSALHDVLVGELDQEKAYVTNEAGEQYQLTWNESAAWFREAMDAEGAPRFKRQLFHRAVILYKDAQRFFHGA